MQLGSALLWLCRRLVAEAPIQPIAWELPYAADAVLKKKKRLCVTLGNCVTFGALLLVSKASVSSCSESYAGSLVPSLGPLLLHDGML